MNFKTEKKLIDIQVKASKIDQMYDSRRMNSRVAILKEENPEVSYDQIHNHVIKEEVRNITKNHLYWLIRWLTSASDMDQRVEEIHYVACQFMQKGMDAIPDKYRYTPNNVFQDRRRFVNTRDSQNNEIIVDATPQLIMMPRGLGKSTQFHVIGLIHEIIKDPHSKWLMTHGNREKAADNLDQIKSFIAKEQLALVFPEIFASDIKTYRLRGSTFRREKVNLVINDLIKQEEDGLALQVRREATLTTGSMGVNLTGQHYEGQYDDDLLTDENSRTQDQNWQVENYYRATFALANRVDRVYPRRLTATEQWGPNFYGQLEKEITVFKVDGRQFNKHGKAFYVSKHWNDDAVDIMRKNWKEWFGAYFHMIPRDSVEKVNLVNNDDFIFRFRGEKGAPSHIKDLDYDIKGLSKQGCVITSKDPSYSSQHTDSQDATATGIIQDGILYMIAESQVAGAKSGQDISSVIYPILKQQVDKYNSDIFVQDCQGTQEVIAQEYYKNLKVDHPRLKFFPYKKPPVKGAKGKAERAQLILAELFALNKIRVHWSCIRMIEEITRVSHTFDFLDTLIQIVSVGNFDMLSDAYKNIKKHSGVRKKRRHMKNINRTTGY